MGTFAAILIVAGLLVAIFADAIAPYDYAEIDLRDRLPGYSADHLLGSDHLGRDVLSRVIHGARVSVYVGRGASALNLIVAALLGIPSGLIGGRFDLILQRFVDAALVLPGLVILISVVSLVGAGLWQMIVVLGMLGGVGQTRLVRSAVIAIKESDYFEASRALGVSWVRLVLRHLVSDIWPVLIVIFSISIAGNVLAEASLSFLGLGIPAPFPAWGSMLARDGRTYMQQGPWLSLWPGVALTIFVFAVNMFGDAVRDLLDPRLRGGSGRLGATKTKKAVPVDTKDGG